MNRTTKDILKDSFTKLTEKDYDNWWKSLNEKQKAETYWKMGDIFASNEVKHK